MADLSPDDFDAYFKAVHGHAPFPWQARLLAQVAREERWPALLDLPTGTGKTAAIDVALFHVALDAAAPAEQRKAPRRIVLVVDRRTVVDQAFERAKKIAQRLHDARDGILRTVADRLRSTGSTDAPLALAQLRGGMPRDDAWARRPDQPLVAVSTVDQVGSRLLFRGYGVSDSMRPIHAGLLGNDALLLLDEVHLSQPFLETLASLDRYREWVDRKLSNRWQFVAMSATPGTKRGFGLTEDDRRDERLVTRLRANKPVELSEVRVSGDEARRRATFVEACAERASALAATGRAVALIVNRVATARDALAAVRQRLGERADIFLATGRMRPLDRDDLDADLGPLVRADRSRVTDARPIVVVSTQCIEAGADFDFDALVTECASLDALRQRFGRLNRLGAINNAVGIVLVRSDAVADDADDAVYGSALAATWRWLLEAPRDFGIDAMNAVLPSGEALAALLPPKARAPVMLPAHLDAWVQTTPIPRPDPDVSLWLRGVDQEQPPEVQIVWRADLTEELLAKAMRDKSAGEALAERVEACAPVGLEALSVPIHAVRAWLTRDLAPDIADVEGRSAGRDETRDVEARSGRCVLLWVGDDSRVIESGQLFPGATIVVPSAYGGLADRTWDPSSDAPVSDLGDRARWQQTRRPTLRLHPALVDPTWPKPPSPTDGEEPDSDDRAAVETWLEQMDAMLPREPERASREWASAAIHALAKRKRRPTVLRLERMDLGGDQVAGAPAYLTVVGRDRVRDDGSDASTEDDGSSYMGVEVTLREHLAGVGSWAKRFAQHCGLPAEVARDIELAALWHDAGKVDPRFQRMLHGGSEYRALRATEPLAKSATVVADRAARVRAQARSGYPRGARHELSSVVLLEANASLLAEAGDRDLVLHLVGSHHGWCRPFAPVVPDPEPVELVLDAAGARVRASSDHALARLDSGIADRFWRLVGRYGWFGLAWLEAILRLADHRRSEEEQRGGVGPEEQT